MPMKKEKERKTKGYRGGGGAQRQRMRQREKKRQSQALRQRSRWATKDSYDRPILFRCCVLSYCVQQGLGCQVLCPSDTTCTVFTCMQNIEQARARHTRAENIVFVYLNPSNTSYLEQRSKSSTIFLVEVSGNTLESSQTRVSTLIFPFYNILFMNILEFSCFADFL